MVERAFQSPPHSETRVGDDFFSLVHEVDLGGVKWEEAPTTGRQTMKIEFTYQGLPAAIEGEHSVTANEHGVEHEYGFFLTIEGASCVVSGVTVRESAEQYTVEDILDRVDRSRRTRAATTFPPGAGIAFYEKILDFIAQFSSQKPVRHVITATPGGEMTIDQWKEKFVPLLEKKGYKEVEENHKWERTYTPEPV